MDTPDRAAALADLGLADAINREQLLASASFGQSSKLASSTQLGRHHYANQFGLSFSSNYYDCDQHYGTSSSQLNRFRENEYCNNKSVQAANDQYSWLLRNHKINRAPKETTRNSVNNYSININLYDNISFNEIPAPSFRALTSGELLATIDNSPQVGYNNDDGRYYLPSSSFIQADNEPASWCFGKFRIFLGCYLLLGVTLAIYSRTALSLAAVKMVANNEMNNGLFALFSSSNFSRGGSSSSSYQNVEGYVEHHKEYSKLDLDSLDDGSCPIETVHRPSHVGIDMNLAMQRIELANYLPASLDTTQAANRSQLTNALRALIKSRVENGQLVDWSPSEQGMIFAAGSVGNLLMAIPLSRLGEIYGAKWIIFIAVFGATLQAAFMPTISTCKVSLIILFQLIFNGLTFGADCVAYTLFAHWLTPTEMSFFVACLMTCYQLGTIISSFVTSKLLVMGTNWCWCFYTPAILCGFWTLFWALLAASEPSKSWLISRKELNFLQRRSKISQMINDMDQQTNEAKRKYCSASASADAHLPIDWLKLAKDPNIWALIAVKFTIRWFFSVYASLMPTYLSSVLHLSVGLIGKVSVINSSIGLALGLLIGYLTKSVINRRPFNLSLATFRKVFQSIVSFGLSLTLLVILIVDCNQWVTIVSLTLNGIFINFYVAAALQVPLDLSPNHCGLITSITTTLALGQAIGAPISGLILNGGPASRSLWRTVWLVSILLNTFSGLLFIVLVDSKPKDYNKYPTNLLSRNNSVLEGNKRQERSTKIERP